MPRRATPVPPSTEAPGPAPVDDAANAPAVSGETASEATEKEAAKRPEIKPTLVLFVRHGKTPTTGTTLPGRAAGLHLSPEGTKQAAAAARRIGRLRNVAAIYASPLERT